MTSVGVALFPCVGCLGNGTGGNHVQQVLPLTLHGGGGLVGGQAGVDVGHGHTCREIKHRGGSDLTVGQSPRHFERLALEGTSGYAIRWKVGL